MWDSMVNHHWLEIGHRLIIINRYVNELFLISSAIEKTADHSENMRQQTAHLHNNFIYFMKKHIKPYRKFRIFSPRLARKLMKFKLNLRSRYCTHDYK